MEITRQEALDCFASHDLIGIGMEADAVRRALHPDNVVTYAFPVPIALDQEMEGLLSAIEGHVRTGGTTACLTNASGLSLTQLEATLAAIRRRFPSTRLQALSATSVLAFAESSRLSAGDVLARLRAAGLDSISADETTAVPIGESSVSFDAWLEIHRLAHHAEITSTASLVFGLGETSENCVYRLFAIRALEAETRGFTAFTLVRPNLGKLADLEPPTAVEYLRTLAIARIVLDNIPSIESSCVTQGLKVTQMAFRFGANDAGSLTTPEAPLKPAFTEEDLRRVIRDAGFTPVERDPLYRTLFLNN